MAILTDGPAWNNGPVYYNPDSGMAEQMQGTGSVPYSATTGKNTFWKGADGQVWVSGDQGVNAAGRWDDNTANYWTNAGFSQVNDPFGVLGASTERTGSPDSPTSDYSPEDLAYLDSLESRYKGQYGKVDNALSQSLQSLLDSYNTAKSDANLQRGRELENLDLQTQDTTRSKDRAIEGINDSARSLANSLRRRIGLASGSDSSAYQITAPGAVAQQASGQRGDVVESFGTNFRNLDLTKRRATEDYDRLLEAIETSKTTNERDARTEAENQRTSIDETLAEIAAQRARLLGGGYDAARSAVAPYESQISQRESTINDLFNKYRTVGKFNPVKVNTPQLRSYTTDKTQVQAQSNTQDPYATYKPLAQEDDENKDLYA